MNPQLTKILIPILVGASLSLPAIAAERVVSAGAAVTELVLALDGRDTLVAVDSTSTLPQQIKVEKLGYHRTLSAEGLLSLNPDLVVGSNEMGPKSALEIVRQANVKVAKLPKAETPEQLLVNIDTLASLLGKKHSAPALKANIQSQVDSINNVKSKLKRSPKVAFLLLRGERGVRMGGNHTPADLLITMAGGENIADFDGYKSTTEETLLALKPDLILVAKPAMDAKDAAGELLKNLPLLAHTPAGQHGQIIDLPAKALLGGLGLSALNAAEDLAQKFSEIQ